MKSLAWCPILGIIVGIALNLGGCAYLKEAVGLVVRKPQVSLVAIDVEKADFSSLDLLVSLQIDNPNDFAIRFFNLRYDLNAAGKLLATGKFDDKITVPKEGRQLLRLPIAVDTRSAVGLASQLLRGRQDLMAELTATTFFEGPLGPIEVNVSESKALRP